MRKKLLSIGLIMAMIASSAVCGYAAEEETVTASSAEEAEAAAEEETVTASSAEEADAAAEEETVTASSAEEADAAAAEEISPDQISVTWDDSRVFMNLSLGNYQTITTYGVEGYEDVPFLSAEAYLDILLEGKETISTEDGVMRVWMNGAEAVIDPVEDTIYFDNTARFLSTHEVDGTIIEEDEFNVITMSEKNQSVQEDANPVTVSLKDYHMPVIAYEDTILMPFLALQNTFGSIRQSNVLAYNGKDYYNAFETRMFLTDKENAAAKDSPYVKAIYSGPFSEKTETTQAYADYGYYAVCLLLDLTFGHKEEKNITTFDEYFTRMNAKEAMCSTDPSSAMMAEIMLFNYLFDSGHDSVVNTDNVFGVKAADPDEVRDLTDDVKESEIGKDLFEDAAALSEDQNAQDLTADVILGALMEKGLKIPEVLPLIIWGNLVGRNKPDDYGDERLDFAGDTAVIYFDAFKDDSTKRDPSYYLDPITEEDKAESTFAFFHECFEEIEEHEEVKNVVINLSDNGGGAAAALVSVLGFLSEDGEVKITNRNMLAGNFREEWYHVDTNLDGIADDQDGYGGQYDFYIMCSGSSYSCGTALPYFAQKNGLAAIIGTQPGGGDCVVGSFVDAYGRCAAYSGMFKLGQYEDGEFVSDEKATTPDLNMMPSIWDITYVPWYDPEGIADAVHQYQDGATEIVYNDKDDSEKISDLLQGFLEKMEQSEELESLIPQE